MRCDNAPDLIAGQFDAEVVKRGIRREFTARNAPHQNAHVERAITTVAADARTLLADTELPFTYWALAMAHACVIRNVIKATEMLDKHSLDVRSVCRIPDFDMLRRWGSLAVVHDPTAKKKNKLAPRGVRMVFVGHRIGMKGWVFLNPVTDRLTYSRDAVFMEDESGAQLLNNTTKVTGNMGDDLLEWLYVNRSNATRPAPSPHPVSPTTPATRRTPGTRRIVTHLRTPETPPTPATPGTPITPCTPVTPNTPATPDTPYTPVTPNTPGNPSSRRTSTASPLARTIDSDEDDGDAGAELGWMDFDEELADELAQIRTGGTSGTRDNPIELIDDEALYAEVPPNYHVAMTGPEASKWRVAVEEELENHRSYGTWEIVPSARARGKVLTTGWTFTRKLSQDGKTLRYKARLYVRGCQQTATQYEETSAPVTTLIMFRLLIHNALTNNHTILHVDIRAAYLNAPVEEELYMQIPDGVVHNGDVVCRLRKSLYGLKQAGFNWHSLAHKTLTDELGCVQLQTDTCVYQLRRSGADSLTITIFVDDFLIAGEDGHARAFLLELEKRFDVKVTDLTVYLSQLVKLADGAAVINQRAYTEDLVRECQLHECNASKVPCGKVAKVERDYDVDCAVYRKIVGKLQWLQVTVRPDITFAVHRLSVHVANPSAKEMVAAKRVLRYLNGTRSRGIEIRGGGRLVAFVDSDWGACLETRRSVSGYVIGYLHDDKHFSPMVWRARKQSCVAQSTCEAEYVAASMVCRELRYVRSLLRELGWLEADPTDVMCDNEAAVIIGNNEVKKSRHVRYIDIRYHFARWCAMNGDVRFVNVDTEGNLADIFTKVLSAARHSLLASRITVDD